MDLHSQTASQIFEVPAEEVTPEQRRAARAIDFGVTFGFGKCGLIPDETLTTPNNARDAFPVIRPDDGKIRGGGFKPGELVDYGFRSGMSWKSNFGLIQALYDLYSRPTRPSPDPHIKSSVLYEALRGFCV